MSFQHPRSRSSHSMHSTQRPFSRASTMSNASPAPEMLSQQHYVPTGQDAAIMHYTQQNGVPMDPMMNQHLMQQQMQAANLEQYQRAFTPHEAQYMLQENNDYRIPMQFTASMSVPPMEPEDRRRKNSAATATNDKELRELLNKNENRRLKDVAQEVIRKERTPQAEKTKQLFAMLWLRKVCKPAKTSVPRNRVYSKYATRCGTERVVPLNPASFGKLVRVIFPGIQTRRLGVRGESKYHYVDLALEDDESDAQGSTWSAVASAMAESNDLPRSASVPASVDFAAVPKQELAADVAAFPTDAPLLDRPVADAPHGPPSKGRLFAYPDTRGMLPDHDASLMYNQILRFPSSTEADLSGDDSIALPDIHPYCPPKTDTDTAEALVALYRTHCTSLIDCIRFCKEKQFFRLFTSFHGTLTVPVQKLFGHPNIAAWIQECDYLMYQKMVRFVSRLTLQAAPPIVITILNNISTNLHAHISKTFQAHAAHVQQAKLQPAAIFASLLHRLIRVNAAAHAAANLLTIDHNREQMWREWVTMVNPKRVMEGSLPDCGYEEVYKVLTVDIRSLLEPLHSPPFPDNPMFECDNQAYATQSRSADVPILDKTLEDGPISTENVLDRWSAFLLGLPARFPNADTRTLLSCISSVGTAALRDITIMGGASYQTWWVMKIFVDEMTLWLAAMGGFLERTPLDPSSVTTESSTALCPNPDPSYITQDQQISRPNTAGPEIRSEGDRDSLSRGSQTQSATSMPLSHDFDQSFETFTHDPSQHNTHMQSGAFQTFDADLESATCQQGKQMTVGAQIKPSGLLDSFQDTDVDDSGIGLGMMDDEMTLARYGFGDVQHTAGHGLLAGEGVM